VKRPYFFWLVVFLLPSPAWTQEAREGAVVAEGTGLVKTRPSIVRVSIELFAQGKSLREALTALDGRRDGALEQLVRLGVARTAVRTGEPLVSTGRFVRMMPFHPDQAWVTRTQVGAQRPRICLVARNRRPRRSYSRFPRSPHSQNVLARHRPTGPWFR